MKHNYYHDVNHRRVAPLVIRDKELYDSVAASIEQDNILNRQIVLDMEYGVGGRPSIPSCWDEGEDLENMVIDDVTDMRYSPWDRMADICRVRPVVTTVGTDPEPTPDPIPDPLTDPK